MPGRLWVVSGAANPSHAQRRQAVSPNYLESLPLHFCCALLDLVTAPGMACLCALFHGLAPDVTVSAEQFLSKDLHLKCRRECVKLHRPTGDALIDTLSQSLDDILKGHELHAEDPTCVRQALLLWQMLRSGPLVQRLDITLDIHILIWQVLVKCSVAIRRHQRSCKYISWKAVSECYSHTRSFSNASVQVCVSGKQVQRTALT